MMLLPYISNQKSTIPSGSFILGELKAFPSADGFGKFTQGGRGGTIIEVTNNNLSGAGSLRDAVETTGARIIVGGAGIFIDANNVGDITANETMGNMTLLGQTFGGDGLTYHDGELEFNGAGELIIRHIRSIGGDAINNTNKDPLRIIGVTTGEDFSNVIIDHCSLSRGDDETLSFGGKASQNVTVTNITVQYSIIGQAFRAAKGVLVAEQTYDVSMIGNFMFNSKERTGLRSSYGSTTYEFINNVVGAWDQPPLQPTWANNMDIVGNIFKTPITPASSTVVSLTESAGNGTYILADTEAFIDNNYLNGSIQAVPVNSNMATYSMGASVINSGGRRLTPSAAMETFIFDNVGANVSRDSLDTGLINDFISNTKDFSNTEATAPAMPTYAAGTAAVITGGDFVADAWKTQYGVSDVTIKPSFFTIDGNTYDNRERIGGTYDGYNYTGGSLTGNNLYTWREIYWEDLAKGFQIINY